ncbi:sigma-70 family RNA polymerase sigma factor, partial [Candidatus Poribacteria bacterium]|nr:sigma-70 family RNA polymerase sigma factor [Candidatus Poribacteria bacterium]
MAKENTLIYHAQTGDEGAFADLMREYYPFVYTIVVGGVNNPHDAEEVVQDTFLSAYRGLTQLEDTTKFKSWLAEIARNCARQWLRKQRGETVPLNEVSEGILQTEDSPDEQLARQEQRELIRRTMETLPQKDRDIARAFYLEGVSYDELIRAHGLSYNAIALRLFRIKRQLSKRLQYLLTGIFVSPGLTLKKIYSGGLTVMKMGTVPKVTVGAAALIAVIFIGFVGVHRMNAPTVEERVYLSPWEDGTARPRSNPEGLPTDTTPDAESGGVQPQIAATESVAGMELIDDFSDQPDETDMTYLATETEFERDAEQDFTTDISMSSDSTSQSAEDVMYAYLKAYRNFDNDALKSLMTEEHRHSYHDNASEPPLEIVDKIAELMYERNSQAEIESSKYVGDEFHFQLAAPALDIPIVLDGGITVFMGASYELIKMRKENGVWRIYDRVHD